MMTKQIYNESNVQLNNNAQIVANCLIKIETHKINNMIVYIDLIYHVYNAFDTSCLHFKYCQLI